MRGLSQGKKTTRLYPDGVDSARQTVALRQVSVLLYWLGLSYDGIRKFLGHLNCPLSKATIWANVRASGLLGNRPASGPTRAAS
ncbi:MAG: hypothetical protein M3O34_14675 [Chloroflexota bacterium]|nr:hypothetical protein [Chloroflexota bacterium]